MEEKRKDLKDSKQRKVLDNLMQEISVQHPSFYYLSTVEVAFELYEKIQKRTGIAQEDYELVVGLSRDDIQILLSIHR
ncbi:MAG: hypothetical protein P8I38_13930 [Arenicella sp.]|jgi:hypothetical protein|nr:hypothetical protein [Arenicella sp.]HAU67463.1 hypothetical protein [Gammaproteobacteria bacterium]